MWSVPIGAVLGFLLMNEIHPRGDRLLIGLVCGGAFPLALRRIKLMIDGVLGAIAGDGFVGCIFSLGLITLVVAVIVGYVIFAYSWIAALIEVVLYYFRKKEIEQYFERLN